MQIQEITGGVLPTNCFIVTDEETGISAVIDPGFTADELFDAIKDLEKLDAILLTHGHFDHIMGVKDIQEMTGAKIYMHEFEKEFATDSRLNLSTVLAERQCRTFEPDHLYTDGDKIAVGNLTFRVLHTPGHTVGSSCFMVQDVIFSGDTIFKGSVGRTDFPTSDPKKMVQSVQRIAEIDENYAIFPAHGDSTTLDYEKKTNPFMKDCADDFGY